MILRLQLKEGSCIFWCGRSRRPSTRRASRDSLNITTLYLASSFKRQRANSKTEGWSICMIRGATPAGGGRASLKGPAAQPQHQTEPADPSVSSGAKSEVVVGLVGPLDGGCGPSLMKHVFIVRGGRRSSQERHGFLLWWRNAHQLFYNIHALDILTWTDSKSSIFPFRRCEAKKLLRVSEIHPWLRYQQKMPQIYLLIDHFAFWKTGFLFSF